VRLSNSSVAGESWLTFAKVVLGSWMMVWIFAAIHNQYLIRIAPEHFTVYHFKIPFVRDYTLLGITWAFMASSSPGIVLGMCLYVAGRVFDRPKLSVKQLLLSTIWVWIAVEVCSIALGVVARVTGKPVFPDDLYPTFERGLLTTQTVQLTAYLTGAIFSIILIIWTWHRRLRLPAPIPAP
jgi:hypothetical protein